MRVRPAVLIGLIVVLSLHVPARAQQQCDPVTSVDFPVDTATFRLVQDFGAPSPRHQGRYHTGEDWYGGRATSLGQGVRAIANGRVTFSSPNGWGRDGGVIILEHTFPDGSIAYSQYGHITESADVRFPATLSCVNVGDVIAVIGDARPAPHLHFEIRTRNPDLPGPGYTWDFPPVGGWERPSKVLLQWQMRLNPAYEWHTDLQADAAPIGDPVVLGDLNLIVLDGNRVVRISHDGRVLWRVNLDREAAGVIPFGFGDGAAVVFTDGTARAINGDGSPGEGWIHGLTLVPPLYRDDGLLLGYTQGRELVALDESARTVFWRVSDVDAPLRIVSNEARIGLITEQNEWILLTSAGEIVDRAQLREPGGLFAAETDLFALTRGGYWQISPEGAWTLPLADPLMGGESAAIWREADGRAYLFDGLTLHAYTPEGLAGWRVDLPGVAGETRLTSTGDFLLLTSSYGTISVVRAEDGAVCNGSRTFGDRRSRVWSRIDGDGVLRVYTADQLLGLDWRTFLLGCA